LGICEFALYHLDGSGSSVTANCPVPFSAALYSRYKYGSQTAAAAFARALAAAFCDRYPELVRGPRLLVASSPYSHVPTAAHSLARELVPVLNATRAGYGLDQAPLVQIERATTSEGDYGTLSAQARDRRMAANSLSFARFGPHRVRGAHLLVVDDVRVTGAHQRSVARASEGLPLGSRTFLYLAAFTGSFDPTVENRLNHSGISTLDDLGGIVRAGDFAWNVRVCKFLLNRDNRADLPRFLAGMPGWFVRELHRNSTGDGYARMDAYAGSHAIVDAALKRLLTSA
jgi:hypothetical protein